MDAYRTMPEAAEAPVRAPSRARWWLALALLAAFVGAIVVAIWATYGEDGLAMAAGTLPTVAALVFRLRVVLDPRWTERYRARVELRAEEWMRDGGRAPLRRWGMRPY